MRQTGDKTSSINKYRFLDGGGEMGALTRDKDWSNSAIGDPETWPQSLKTTLGIILNSKFPMFLWWGEELICFYNDAYRPSLGQNGKHPSILGTPARLAWPEIWDIISPLINQVRTTGEATWKEDELVPIYRNGKIEEVYWTFSYSPVTDESGTIAGVLVTCTETTGKVVNQRNLEESEERFRAMAEGADILITVSDERKKAIYFNKAWVDLTGREMPELLELGRTNIIHADDRKKTIDIYRDAFKNKTPFTCEFRVLNKHGHYSWILSKSNPRLFADGSFAGYITTSMNITERKHAEEEIKRFKFMADNASDPFMLIDEDAAFAYMNKSALEGLGYTEDEAKQLTVPDIDKAYTPQMCKILFDKAQQQIIAPFETFHTRKNGTFYPVEVSLTGLILSGKPYVFSVVRNISERKEAEEALKESEQRLNIIIKASELGTWELDLKTDKCFYSDRYLEIMGSKRETPRTHSIFVSQIYPDDLPVRDIAYKKALETGILQYTVRFTWNDKSIHWIEVKGKVFYDEENQPQKMIGTVRDVTEEKHHQLELMESEQKFRLLADSIPQMVWTADARGNVNYFNLSVLDYSGLNLKKIIKGGWMQMVHPDDLQENIKAWAYSVKTGRDFLYEHRFKRYDGEYRWQLSRAIPQRDTEGKIQMWVGSSTDVQQMKEQEQQKDYFISVASHELKTPITSMKGHVQMLKRKYGESKDPFLRKSLQVIDKQIATLIGLISELLDISKIKSGRLYLKKVPFEINELIEEVIEEMNQIHADYEILFSKETIPLINADRERIGQVLTNFLTNAIKYSPNSNIVEVTCKVEDNQVVVSVIDAGIGIHKHHQERIFERFFRVEGKNEKNFPGFGIGLFIASEIVQRHDGNIGVKSEPGKGSIFYFSVPTDSDE